MSKLKHIINGLIWTVVIAYFIVIAAVHIPFVQSWLGNEVGSALASKLGTSIKVSRVDIGFLNRIIIDGIVIQDQNGKQMITASRLAAKIDYYELLRNGRIYISSAQAFGLNGNFYRKNAQSKPNYQFALDSLASKDTTKQSSVELSINSLIIRHGRFSYSQFDKTPTDGRFNTGHIDVNNISGHFIIPYYTKDSLVAEIKKLSLDELAGFKLKNLTFRLTACKQSTKLEKFELKLPNSELHIGYLNVKYQTNGNVLASNTLRFDGTIEKSSITPKDFSYFSPILRNLNVPVKLYATFSGTLNSLDITKFNLYSEDKSIRFAASGSIQDFKHPNWNVNIKELLCNVPVFDHAINYSENAVLKIPESVKNIGSVDYKGRFSGRGERMEIVGTLHTDAGTVTLNAVKRGSNVSAEVIARNVDIGGFIGNKRFGVIDANIKSSTMLEKEWGTPSSINIDGIVSRFDYNGYSYRDITMKGIYDTKTIKGGASFDDPNGQVSINGAISTSGNSRKANIEVILRNLDPAALSLTNKWKGNKFDLDAMLQLDIANNKKIPKGNIHLSGFKMASATETYKIESIDVQSTDNSLTVNGDFGQAELTGCYDIKTLSSSITSLLHSKLPTLFTQHSKTENNCMFNARLKDTEWLRRLFGIPVILKSPLTLNGAINDREHYLALECQTKDIVYNDGDYKNIILSAGTSNDTLCATINADKIMGNGHSLGLQLDAMAYRDKLLTTVKWNNHREHPIVGSFCAETAFMHNSKGSPDIQVEIKPSELTVSDTVWHVLPANIKYSEGNLSINNFSIEHNRQHVKINGQATRSANDSICVDIKDVDVNYILNLVNFHAVDFKGLATGKAYVKSVFFEPDAYVDLEVKNFLFEDGRLGNLLAHVDWNKAEKQIDISAQATDSEGGSTLIDGYVSPSRNYIDLGIEARKTNVEFIESFCGSFMDDVKAKAFGKVHVVGPLNCINLIGQLTADGSAHIKPLNVTYHLQNDTVRFIPDNIIFSADTIRDRNGNIGIVDGKLHHEHLTHLTYDIGIKTDHLLCYDTHSYGDDTFYGTAYGTGTCKIQGGNGRIDIDVDIKPEKNSFIEYDAASPEAISGQEYITWNDVTPRPIPSCGDSISSIAETPTSSDFGQLASIPSDMRINFIIDMTPEATLRVLMDRNSGDYIALHGTGSLKAAYFNKGSFDIFGTYLIDNGVYKLTIQNIIKKEFQFQQGSTIVFGGDPYNAALNLKALYTINGVPLSDLHLGRSFSSSNVRVDCMMNIGGTPQSPHVDFDLDLPTVNSDAKQMVKTIINGEEEMNQQVVYLLGVGRFYIQNNNESADDDTQQSQTSLAMQSLLSGTISQQINSLLSSLVKNNNWSFGANISTGDEGFNNAEYEGLLTGRLLNNRLIINGQFGYRDNANATTSFIGDFDISYLLYPSGNLAIKVYNQTNDRYFTKSSLNTQGIGLMMKKDFNTFKDLFNIVRKRKK